MESSGEGWTRTRAKCEVGGKFFGLYPLTSVLLRRLRRSQNVTRTRRTTYSPYSVQPPSETAMEPLHKSPELIKQAPKRTEPREPNFNEVDIQHQIRSVFHPFLQMPTVFGGFAGFPFGAYLPLCASQPFYPMLLPDLISRSMEPQLALPAADLQRENVRGKASDVPMRRALPTKRHLPNAEEILSKQLEMMASGTEKKKLPGQTEGTKVILKHRGFGASAHVFNKDGNIDVGGRI